VHEQDFKKAQMVSREMLKIRPDISIGYFLMSRVLFMDGKAEDAFPYLEKLVELEPENEKAYTGLAFIYGIRGDYDAAIELCKKAIEAKSDFGAAYYEIAVNYFRKGIFELPVEYLTEDIKNSPGYPEVLAMIGDELIKHKRIKQAYELYLESHALNEGYVYALNGLGWMSATSSVEGVRNTAAAVKYAQKICEFTEYKNAKYLDTLAAALAADGAMDKAVKRAQEAIELAKLSEDDGFAKQITVRLELYKNGKSYFDPALK
jgi:tetratricopeptide (TPR) repeat protein